MKEKEIEKEEGRRGREYCRDCRYNKIEIKERVRETKREKSDKNRKNEIDKATKQKIKVGT